MFDVPEKQRNKRDYLRHLLAFIGFVQYQQSVYVYPFECKKEIDLIKKVVEESKLKNSFFKQHKIFVNGILNKTTEYKTKHISRGLFIKIAKHRDYFVANSSKKCH